MEQESLKKYEELVASAEEYLSLQIADGITLAEILTGTRPMQEMLLVTGDYYFQAEQYLEHVLERSLNELPPRVKGLLPPVAAAIGSTRDEDATEQLDTLIIEARNKYSTNVQSGVLGGAIVAEAILADRETMLALIKDE